MQNHALRPDTVPVPVPGSGEVLVKTLACGICGSDLHCLAHGKQLIDTTRAVAGIELFDIAQPVVMGHEICGEVVEHGPGARKAHRAGTRVVALPFLLRERPVTLGYGGLDTPGGFAEYMLLSEDLMLPVPDGIPNDVATLAEPLAVAIHAVNRGRVAADDVPIVIGCGPIGLAIIAVLRMRGIGPIVAADFSPSRRRMAERMGADIVVDPRERSPYESWREMAGTDDPTRIARQTPMFQGFAFRPAVVFECVGVPGLIQQILAGTPPCSRVVVAGLCMEPDVFQPTYAILKEIDLAFCIAYTPQEFAEAFSAIAEGRLDVAPLITGHVGLDGVDDAFRRLADPDSDVKIIVTH